jgi:hypothetical protein
MDQSPTAQWLPAEASDVSVLHEDLQAEYFKLIDIVDSFDQRLLTIKGWGVTLSLASLGFGFQQDHYGLFLVAAASGLAFWIVEGTTKLQQRRYYPRMGDIEVAAYELFGRRTPTGPVSSPLIDWSWYTAWPRIRGGKSKGDPRVPHRWSDVNENPGRHPLTLAHVAFPHLIAVITGTTLFVVGLTGHLGPI